MSFVDQLIAWRVVFWMVVLLGIIVLLWVIKEVWEQMRKDDRSTAASKK